MAADATGSSWMSDEAGMTVMASPCTEQDLLDSLFDFVPRPDSDAMNMLDAADDVAEDANDDIIAAARPAQASRARFLEMLSAISPSGGAPGSAAGGAAGFALEEDEVLIAAHANEAIDTLEESLNEADMVIEDLDLAAMSIEDGMQEEDLKLAGLTLKSTVSASAFLPKAIAAAYPDITKPAYCGDGSMLCVGTRIAAAEAEQLNCIAFVEVGKDCSMDPLQIRSFTIPACMNNIVWRDANHIIIAAGSSVRLVRVLDWAEFTYESLPIAKPDVLHTAPINRMAMNADRKTLATAGSDGRLGLIDVHRFCLDAPHVGTQSTKRFDLTSNVTSVSWESSHVVAVTCEDGSLHMFDRRASTGVPCFSYRSAMGGLTGHVVLADDLVVVSHAAGELHIVDRRTGACDARFNDPAVQRIDELVLAPDGRTIAVVGSPCVSLWQYEKEQMSYRGSVAIAHNLLPGQLYATRAEFRDARTLAISDSLGTIAVYDIDMPDD